MRMRMIISSFLCMGVGAMGLWFGSTKLKAADSGAAAGTSFNVKQLGDAMDSYAMNTITNNGQTDYSITVPKDKWNFNFIVSLSPNGTVIWMTNGLTEMPDAQHVSAEALLKVLKKNNDIGPMFFSIADDSLRMNYPVPNYGLTPESLKKKIEAMAATVLETEPLWNPDNLKKK